MKGKDGLVREVSTVATEFSAVETDADAETEVGRDWGSGRVDQ